MVDLRYELAVNRIREMLTDQTVPEVYQDYFHKMAEFTLLIDEAAVKIFDGSYRNLSMEELADYNHRFYQDILPENYDYSYANPAYACEKFGKEMGQLLSYLYVQLRQMIVYVHEGKKEYLDIQMELLLEIYNLFEAENGPDLKEVQDAIYWHASDYCDVFFADSVAEMVDPDKSFAVKLIKESNLSDLRYLYFYGKYVSDDVLRTAKHLGEMSEERLQSMADVYTEGYRVGFEITGKDLSIKSSAGIRYMIGFEQMVKRAISNFEAIGLKAIATSSGVSGAHANMQYEYDHKDDHGLFYDKKYVERRLEVMQTTFEKNKELAKLHAGPAVIETFGEEPFAPVKKEQAVSLTEKQDELFLNFRIRSGQMTSTYIPAEERSFTIIAYPLPSIGDAYEEIFDEIVKINTLDAETYKNVQQTLIDALDQGEYVHIKGYNGNHTDLMIHLWKLHDPEKETIFENCVADVNIPVGEVFTSPVLEGTNGVLHVSKVYLNELQYKNLEIQFANGMIADYNCSNFEHELENKEFIHDNVLFKHPTLAIGEFAIGTNTTAYVVAKKYGIEDKMPILIAEKMGPHFAVGDTCYSQTEDVRVYNPNGKEIVAKENSVSALRKEDPSKAYYHCHTDITIPYEELESITVVCADGREIRLIENSRFVLPGTEILNEPLEGLLQNHRQ